MRPFIAIAMLLTVSEPIGAHHRSASFDTSTVVALHATVSGYIWVNPHFFLKFEAKDETGTVRNRPADGTTLPDAAEIGTAPLPASGQP